MLLLAIFILWIEAKSGSHDHSKKKEDKHKEKSSYSCQLCCTIADLTKNEIIEKTAEQTIKFIDEKCPNITLLNKFCGFISPDFIKQISKGVDNKLNAREFCKSIQFC